MKPLRNLVHIEILKRETTDLIEKEEFVHKAKVLATGARCKYVKKGDIVELEKHYLDKSTGFNLILEHNILGFSV